jgi:hypothetical protein
MSWEKDERQKIINHDDTTGTTKNKIFASRRARRVVVVKNDFSRRLIF